MKGVCWQDWITVAGRQYKMVEYGDLMNGNYMLFQNKPTTDIIRIEYQVPCYADRNGERVQTKEYQFYSIEQYTEGALYRYN